MPGKRGVDTYEEREFLEYRPDIKRTPGRIVTEESTRTTKLADVQLSDADKKFFDDIISADKKLDDFQQLLNDQQALMEIPVPADLPDVNRALQYMIELVGNASLAGAIGATKAKKNNVITFDIYSKAYETWVDGAQRGFGGDVVGSDDPVADVMRLKSQIDEYDNKRVLKLVIYTILSYALEFIGRKVVGNIPLVGGALKKQFIKWAKSLLDDTLKIYPQEPSPEGDEEAFANDDAWKDLYRNAPPDTARPTPPAEAIGYADKILEFVHFNALHGETPGANPTAFYMRPLYDYARATHVATKVGVQMASAGAVEFQVFGEQIDLFTPGDLFYYKGYVGGQTADYNKLLFEDNSATHRLSESGFFNLLKEFGYTEFNRILDNMIGALKYWYRGPDAICCVIRIIGGLGKIDLTFLLSLRTVLIYMINKERDESKYVFDALSQLLNTLVLALTSKIAGVLESISQRFIRRLEIKIDTIAADDAARDCTPLDELLSVIQGGILAMQIDLTGMINSIIGDLTLRDAKLVQTTANLERKQRLERFLKVVDAIINALETGDLCSDSPDDFVEEEIPVPSIDEIERFLDIGLLPGFEDADRSRKYIIEKYKRDPSTGQPIDSIISGDVYTRDTEVLREILDQCNKRVDQESLKKIVESIKQRGVL